MKNPHLKNLIKKKENKEKDVLPPSIKIKQNKAEQEQKLHPAVQKIKENFLRQQEIEKQKKIIENAKKMLRENKELLRDIKYTQGYTQGYTQDNIKMVGRMSGIGNVVPRISGKLKSIKMKTVSFMCDWFLIDSVKVYSKLMGVSKGEFIRRAITSYIERITLTLRG